MDVSTTELADDWDVRWRTWHPAVVVEAGGRTLRVRPPWEDPQPGTIDVAIEPAQAFGTGAHETTRLSLALLMGLEPCRSAGRTGAAARACSRSRRPSSASRRSRGCDHEAASVAATRDGARDNGVEVEATRCDLRRAPGPWAPTVTANLVRPLLLEVAALMDRVPERLVVSGLLRAEADEVAAAFAARGMAETRPEGGLGMERAAAGGTVIGYEDVEAAARRIDGVAHRTPVLTSRQLDEATGAQVFLKAENLQRIGAFKFRGAYNAVASLSGERARRRRRHRFLGQPRAGARARRRAARREGDDPHARGRAREQARGHARLRRRGDRVRPLRLRPRGAARRAGRGARRDPRASVRRSSRDGRAGHRREGADRAGRPARPAAGVRRRRRAARPAAPRRPPRSPRTRA